MLNVGDVFYCVVGLNERTTAMRILHIAGDTLTKAGAKNGPYVSIKCQKVSVTEAPS